jgi:imidazolonepropionase-like amidohydrolase
MDEQEAARVDFIKITENTLAPDLFLATVAEAHRRGFLVSGHVPMGLGIFELANAGLSSVEHASNVLRLGHPREPDIARAVREGTLTREDASERYEKAFDQNVARAAYVKLAAAGVAVTPTLIGGRQLAWLDETDHSEDTFLRYLTRDFIASYQWRIERMANESADQRAQRKTRYRRIASQLPVLQEAGVMLLAGSDSAALNTYVYPAEALHTELGLFVEAGLSPLEALQAATINAARFMRRADLHGSIAVGKAADLVVLESNPLADIHATRHIHALVYRGEYRDRGQLDALLEEAATRRESLERGRAGTGRVE